MATNTYVALDKITVSGTSTTSVTFSSVPQGYTDLVLVISGSLYGGANRTSFVVQVGNGSIDTGTNYSSTWVAGNGTTAVSSRYSNGTNFLTGHISEAVGTTIVNFMNYANTSTYKTFIARGNSMGQVGSFDVGGFASLWRSTSAINTIKIYPNDGTPYNSGTTFSLYGIKGTTTGTGTAKATGGTITYDSFGYVMHTFTSTGTFTPSVPLTCDYLVVAGGGGSGTTRGGGGGAGGLYSTVSASGGGGAPQAPISVGASAYTITVGGGGAGATSGSGQRGSNGQSSSIAGSGITTITSIGGGGGGGSSDINGSSGGSGGGGRQNSNSTGGSGTSSQGYAGGNAVSLAGAGGGGGAGAVGSNGTATNNIGAGGAGIAVTITGSSVFYAGGGAGGGEDGRTASGGAGGGGNTANAGTPNTGGGAGGPNTDTGSSPGFNGGSGIVVIKYYGL